MVGATAIVMDMKIKFTSKAMTLMSLSEKIGSASVPKMVVLGFDDWHSDKKGCLDRIQKEISSDSHIVRSSCAAEDGYKESRAGQFLSLLDVDSTKLEASISRVFKSYYKPSKNDQVLIQPMLRNVVRSGVAFSHDPVTCSPYIKVNWSNCSDTTFVTSGLGGRTWFMAKNAKTSPPRDLKQLMVLMQELEKLLENIPIDVEFAVTKDDFEETLWLLQARPLVLRQKPETANEQEKRLKQIETKINSGLTAHPFLVGRKTAYGMMPDWNPAEVIGIRPKPLALSLYRELITDNIWAYQRNNYGYRNLRSVPLMQQFFGIPFIDVRASFNSFIPADLSDELASKLAEHYMSQLLSKPSLHDKVEFEIVFSCYTLDLEKRLSGLCSDIFSETEKNDIFASLIKLTNKVIQPVDGLWRSDAEKIGKLRSRHHKIMKSDLTSIEKIYWLVEDAKRYGTLPFAGLARAGFIAIQLLKSMVLTGVITEDEYGLFMRSLSTVTSKLSKDRANMDKKLFLEKYGHLRPGTYDIMSPRYDENPDLYFDWEKKVETSAEEKCFSLSPRRLHEFSKKLSKHGLYDDPHEFFEFLRSGITQREKAKFYFSRNLSDALSLIGKVGDELGFTKEDISFSNIRVFQELKIGALDQQFALQKEISSGRKQYNETSKTALPPLITKPRDVWAFELPVLSPNFITQKQITAGVVESNNRAEITGKIVCIPNADPGFDWIFSHGIAGLLTAWGGANSHMAIRAGEMGLPSVIGAGEDLYKIWSKADRLMIDCAGQRVEILSQ